MTNRLSY